MRKIKDLTGKRFGSLVVLRREGKIGKHIAWICKCDCGSITKPITGNNLKNGHVRSCGCLYKKHEMTGTRIYSIWNSMKSRCNNENTEHYAEYGGRGISVCSEWNDNFKSFYDWSMSHGYSDDLTIDRINVNGNYEPSNCRWATQKEQQNNRRNSIVISYNGKERTLSEWSEELGIDYHKLLMRIKRGWSAEKAFSENTKK